ncbi:MAG: hypothetical protein PVI78_11015 [Anaerolineales bacterium]|jgi:hypothetical protein
MNDEGSSVEETHVEVTPTPVEVEPPKKPSRLSLFFKKALRWAAGIGLLFAFGVSLTWLVRVLPLVRELRAVRSDLMTANAQIADLEELVVDMQVLEDNYASLEANLDDVEHHLSLLKILSDVSASRLALAMDNPLAARTALSDTDERLSILQEDLEGDHANTVVKVRVRLQQAISEIDTNIFAAEGDLEIITNDLLNLERDLFNE